MSNYTKATNFASKDALLTGNPSKIVKGTEIDNEFNAISTAVSTKFDTASLAAPGPIGATTPAAINGTTGTFSSAVSGTTGTFSGNVQMASQNGGQLAGLRNKIINGDMRVSQRGTSFPAGAVQYGLDRWQFFRIGAVAGATCAQTTAASAITLGYNNYMQVNHDAGNASLVSIVVGQTFETINIRDLAGQTVTFSCYIFCSGDAVGRTTAALVYGTGTNGSLGAGFTGTTVAGSSVSTSNASWVRSTITATLPSNATQLGVQVTFVPSVTGGASDYFGLVGAQLELGPVATPFEQRPIGMELALCQRYTIVIPISTFWGSGTLRAGGTASYGFCPLPVQMRTVPAATPNTNTVYVGDTNTNYTSLGISGFSSNGIYAAPTFATSAGTAGQSFFIYSSASAVVLSAEL